MKKKAIVGAVAGLSVLSLALTGCAGGSSNTDNGRGTPVKGGTITWLDVQGQFEATDPAAVYLGSEIAALRRTVYRGLTALPATNDPNPKPIADLATDTGTTPDSGKTWSFTLKDGVTWQDGSQITCEDLQYGLSRSFDADIVSLGGGVGTTYMAQYGLYDPEAPDFDISAEYTGPFTGSADAQKHFNNAASCSDDNKTITYHFKNPWPDFAYAAAALFSTDPYQKSFDKGTANQWLINSNGPYKFEGKFDNNGLNEFVRNENYDPKTDSVDARGAYPDTIKFEFVADQDTVTERLLADSGDDQTALTPGNIPASKYSLISSALSNRVKQTTSPYTRFLQINSVRMSDPDLRRALVVATNRDGVIQAWGGENYGTPSTTIVSSAVAGYQENAATKGDKTSGDPEAAKALLKKAGKEGYELAYAFPDTPTNQKIAAVLQQSWEAAGFKVVLNPIAKTAKPGYYAQMLQKDKAIDVFQSGWAADWPALFAVIPPILQSNPADSTTGVGFNYGFYSNAEVDKLIAEATASTDPAEQIKKLQKADEIAGADGAYVPILNQKNYFIYGSKVGGFLPDVAMSFYPDLGAAYVVSSK
ncbi:MAG TPA: ABC transporter substrate-binding protein [Microbacteriaceae bacterium]|nr:ABC transporter substrate-binding protein [Microbacteriaceae bacterium]